MPPGQDLKMLVFDSSHTSDIVFERQLTNWIVGRDLRGFFTHIWNVHPLDTILLPADSPRRFGSPESFELAPGHTFVAGRMERYPTLRRLVPLNFLFAQMSLMRRLRRLVRSENIQIIRADDSWYCGLLALYLARRTRRPLVVGVWGNPGAIRAATGRPLVPRLFRYVWVEELVERIVLRSADRVIVQNEDNRGFVLSMGVPVEKTRIFRLGNTVHEMHFVDPAVRQDGRGDLAELGLEGPETFLVISRLEPLKLVDDVIRMLAVMKDSSPSAKVLLAGDGTQRAELEALAESLGIADRVIFAGNRDQSWLARVVPHVAAVVSPLTGRALVEAGLGGVPLIAYDVEWHSEVVQTGVTGELVPHRDHHALAEAAERILKDGDYRQRLGAGVRRLLLEMMDPAANNRDQRAVYAELLAEKGRSLRVAQAYGPGDGRDLAENGG